MNHIVPTSVISSWKTLDDSKMLKNGTPNEFVLFSLATIRPSDAFNSNSSTATATIGRRDSAGRLFQNSLHSDHFAPRKFKIDLNDDLGTQINALLDLTIALNSNKIDVNEVPIKVGSPKKWDIVYGLLKSTLQEKS